MVIGRGKGVEQVEEVKLGKYKGKEGELSWGGKHTIRNRTVLLKPM